MFYVFLYAISDPTNSLISYKDHFPICTEYEVCNDTSWPLGGVLYLLLMSAADKKRFCFTFSNGKKCLSKQNL